MSTLFLFMRTASSPRARTEKWKKDLIARKADLHYAWLRLPEGVTKSDNLLYR